MKFTSVNVRRVRILAGMTQVEFAAALGVHPMTVSRWERGCKKPSKLACRPLEQFFVKWWKPQISDVGTGVSSGRNRAASLPDAPRLNRGPPPPR